MAGKNVVIRRANTDDAESLFRLQRASALAGFEHIFPPDKYPFPDEEERQNWAELVRNPDIDILVADRGETSIAVAVVGNDELMRFFVLPDEWGTGVVNDLHTAVIELVRTRGDSQCRLWVLEENRRARRFYERHGWTLDGRTREAKFPPFPPAVGYTKQIEPGRSSASVLRYAIAIAFVVLWMAIGWATELNPNAYLLVGIPLTIGFQLIVVGRPLREAWVVNGAPLSARTVNIWAVLVSAITPLVLLFVEGLHSGGVLIAYLIAAALGALGVGYTIKQASRETWRSLLRCLSTAGAIGIAFVILSRVLRDPPAFSGGTDAITEGLRSFLIYIPVVYTLEEVTFRGVIDRYLSNDERRSLGSALVVSALWGLWHLPVVGFTKTAVVALLMVHVPVGIFLSLERRRSGNLLVPGVTHALISSVRNAVL